MTGQGQVHGLSIPVQVGDRLVPVSMTVAYWITMQAAERDLFRRLNGLFTLWQLGLVGPDAY